MAAEQGHQNVGSDPRVKAAAQKLSSWRASQALASQGASLPVAQQVTDGTGANGATDFGAYLLNTMTPEQQAAYIAKGQTMEHLQAPEIAYRQSGGDLPYQSPEVQAITRAGTRIEDASTQNQTELNRLAELAERNRADNQAAIDLQSGQINALDPLNGEYVARSRALADELGGYRTTANQRSDAALGEYGTELGRINARNDAALGDMYGVYDDLRAPLPANLALDPDALAAQQQSLGFFAGGMNGALDYSSQAAGAYADPKYVAMRDQGLEDLYGVSKGSMDVKVGQADPAAYAAAMRALEQASELSNPAVTDKENFLYEQARQAWESEMRGAAAAKMSNLRRRGMAGGGAEITQGALTNADISQKRVLSDLAASAGAVDRASEMLKLKGSLASGLNSEGNALATGNANRKLSALGLYQQGAETAQQSSFDQEYKRGVAADQASSDNQQTRLQSGIAHGNQANAMQDDAFAVNSFNKEFEQRERDALWGRTADRTGMTLSAGAQSSNNAGNLFQAKTSVASNNYVRDRDVVQGKDLANSRENQAHNTQLDRRLGVGDRQIAANNTGTAMEGDIIGKNIAANQWTALQLAGNDTAIAGQAAAERAERLGAEHARAEQEQADRTGIFGLPYVGSKKGVLGQLGTGIEDIFG